MFIYLYSNQCVIKLRKIYNLIKNIYLCNRVRIHPARGYLIIEGINKLKP